MTVKACFPTLVYFDRIFKKPERSKKLCSELLEECFRIQEIDEEGRQWSQENFASGYTSYSSFSNLHKRSSTFAKLETQLNKHVLTFAKSLEYDIDLKQLEMVSCWVNVVPPGCFHSLHLHPLSAISGTIYLQVPKGSGQLRLEDPRLSRFMAAPPKKADASFKNQSQLFFKPALGKIILFESWLRHEVEVNQGAGTRVSVSFNYAWQ